MGLGLLMPVVVSADGGSAAAGATDAATAPAAVPEWLGIEGASTDPIADFSGSGMPGTGGGGEVAGISAGDGGGFASSGMSNSGDVMGEGGPAATNDAGSRGVETSGYDYGTGYRGDGNLASVDSGRIGGLSSAD